MKQPIALRIDAGLLEQVRHCALNENRTVTNFIETILKREVARALCAEPHVVRPNPATPKATPARRAPARGISPRKPVRPE
jgi:hypothetical protein